MIIRLTEDADAGVAEEVRQRAIQAGFAAHPLRGSRMAVVLTGAGDEGVLKSLRYLPGVAEVGQLFSPFRLSSRESKPEDTVVDVAGVQIGGQEIVMIAGPCAVESEAQIMQVAGAVAGAGARLLRGGAFKPRTSPYSFQGLAEEGLELLNAAGKAHGLPVVTEVVACEDIATVARYADMLQIGARNMQNFALLTKAGETGRPILLKRGPSATIEEWLYAAEYVLLTGNSNVVLCERGIRTFESYTRNTLDLAAVVAATELSHLPVIADPSHGTGRWRMVAPLAKAALFAGADGIMVEVHPEPKDARSDGFQSLTIAEFSRLTGELGPVAAAAGRKYEGGARG